MKSIGEKLLGAALLFGFILVIVPLHLLDSTWSILQRYVFSHLSLRMLTTAGITVYVAAMVMYSIVGKMPEDPAKYERLCGDVYGCGVNPVPGFAKVLFVAAVLAALIVVVNRANHYTN